ncbi:MAG: type III pantothenate kinase [Caldilineae bacterium]|nr:type III pantothenate kinase [Chloroflexota bacterium]MCB9176239.1 type III pantothenate kinase [Caldilineae bacterium]
MAPAGAPGSLLAIDVSNTHTGLALWSAGGLELEPAEHWQIATETGRTPDEYRILFAQLLAASDRPPASVDACVLACVVPEVTEPLTAACRRLFGCAPMTVGPGLRSGLRIRTESPRELGPDRVANAVAAIAHYGAPVMVLDFSTALTVDVVDAAGDYAGAIIAPGIEIAAEALAERTARLRRIDLIAPPTAIAGDTEGALRSGLVFGYIGLVEGLIERVRGEIGPSPAVATGDAPWLAALLAETHAFDDYAPLLTLDGLRRIHALNQV